MTVAAAALVLCLPLHLGSPNSDVVSLLQPAAARTVNGKAPVKPKLGPQSNFRPICQVGLDDKCEEGRAAVACPTGGNYTYYLDRGLVTAIEGQLRGHSFIEFGAGEGCYTRALRDDEVEVTGFDKFKGVFAKTQGLVQYADATGTEIDVGCADFVLSLDMAEHVRKGKPEEQFLQNLHRHSSKGIVLSWASSATSQFTNMNGEENIIERDPPGVNYKDEGDVIVRMAVLGYQYDAGVTKKLRDAATHVPWLRNSLFYFVKNKPSKHCPK